MEWDRCKEKNGDCLYNGLQTQCWALGAGGRNRVREKGTFCARNWLKRPALASNSQNKSVHTYSMVMSRIVFFSKLSRFSFRTLGFFHQHTQQNRYVPFSLHWSRFLVSSTSVSVPHHIFYNFGLKKFSMVRIPSKTEFNVSTFYSASSGNSELSSYNVLTTSKLARTSRVRLLYGSHLLFLGCMSIFSCRCVCNFSPIRGDCTM